MGSAVGDFTVTATEVVSAAVPVQDHWLPLSNLDLLLPPLDVSIFFCYDNNPVWTFAEKVSALKRALAEALVSFYAFGGEVVENSLGEPEILCNNRGVEFSQAEALDVALRELRLYDPDASVEGKLVPKKNYGVLSVQVSFLILRKLFSSLFLVYYFHRPFFIRLSLTVIGRNDSIILF